MLTLQILDSGEVLSLALDGSPLVLGSGPEAHVRLSSEGVAPRHAEIRPLAGAGGSGTRYRLIDLGSETGARVDGQLVMQVELGVGQEIQLGGARLVVGRRVVRRATPDDVLSDGAAMPRVASAPAPRLRRRMPEPRRRPAWWAWGLGAAAVLAVVVGTSLAGGSRPPIELGQVAELQRQGRFDQAETVLQRLQQAWADGDPAREQMLAEALAFQRRIVTAVADMEAEVREGTRSISYSDQLAELRRRSDRAADEGERIAARLTMARLADLRMEGWETGSPGTAPPQPDAVPDRVTDATPTPPEKEPADSQPPPKPPSHPMTAETAPTVVAVGPEPADEERIAAIGVAADDLVAQGDPGAAAQWLRRAVETLPRDQAAPLLARAADLEARVATAPREEEAAPTRIRDPLGELLDATTAADAAFAEGRFAAARQALERAIELLGGRDPRMAEHLARRLDECGRVLELHRAVADRLLASVKPEVELGDGSRGRLIDMRDDRLVFALDSGSAELPWTALPPAAIERIAKALSVPDRAWLGAVALASLSGDDQRVEAWVASVRRGGLEAEADAALARHRGEVVPPGGYRFVGSRLDVEGSVSEAVRTAERQIESALRRDDRARAEALDKLVQQGPDALPATLAALRSQYHKGARKLAGHAFRRNWDRVAAVRRDLDGARAAALELIFDEVRYFYPFRPPAVSGERSTEYQRVQQEVDALVAAVYEQWDASLRFPIPAALRTELERLRWLGSVLEGFGEPVDAGIVPGWVLALPDGKELSVRTFCTGPDEVERLRQAEAIEALNVKRAASLTRPEREELALTNGYRRAMGRMPLALDARLLAAARGHSEEMDRLGYFAHVSPDPARRTPELRVRLAGYDGGSSENIARCGSAEAAHVAWLHSSGHHRNILNQHHTEFACGQRGNLWTQNFGGGDSYLAELGR